MASNTKICSESKKVLKDTLAKLALQVYSFDFEYDEYQGITTMTVVPFKGSNVTRVATSVMSPGEVKFRKSVGRYYACSNYTVGKYIDMPKGNTCKFLG